MLKILFMVQNVVVVNPLGFAIVTVYRLCFNLVSKLGYCEVELSEDFFWRSKDFAYALNAQPGL